MLIAKGTRERGYCCAEELRCTDVQGSCWEVSEPHTLLVLRTADSGYALLKYLLHMK